MGIRGISIELPHVPKPLSHEQLRFEPTSGSKGAIAEVSFEHCTAIVEAGSKSRAQTMASIEKIGKGLLLYYCKKEDAEFHAVNTVRDPKSGRYGVIGRFQEKKAAAWYFAVWAGRKYVICCGRCERSSKNTSKFIDRIWRSMRAKDNG